MNKKNIIISVVLLVVIVLLLIVYQNDFLFKKNTNNDAEKGNILPTISVENKKSPSTGEISDEACIDITAYSLRMVELRDKESIRNFSSKIEELKNKYGAELVESDYFDEFCNERISDPDVYKKLEEKMKELGSEIEF